MMGHCTRPVNAKRTALCQHLTDTLVAAGQSSMPECVLQATAASCGVLLKEAFAALAP